MKILICGAFSAGKTETVMATKKLLETYGEKVSIVEEVARKAPFALNKLQAFETTAWLYCQQICSEIEINKEASAITICDRGIPDIFSHFLDILEKAPSSDRFLDAFFPALKQWCSTYEKVFFCPVNHDVPIEADSLRVSDPAYRRKMETHCLEALEKLSLDYVKLPFDKEDRATIIYKSVRSSKN
ncbi:ATP-binding protein [Mesorhizobium sp. CA12]|uniref:ATP/GTP-binding protein n=1 Tax=Mesorhizobium sp. CA12 TaxID=2876644 RepID=UPI001CCBFBB0|nr:ATP-binding protein [Mesorhizobium sp. CA12]MBZ9858871.1 ATP-binding protein [Mesorhizobium sp. CA12]